MNSLERAIERLALFRDWLPGWLAGVLILSSAIALVLLSHRSVMRLLRRALGQRSDFLRQLLRRVEGPTRLGLGILVVSAILEATPFGEATTAWIRHGLLVAFILLVGWVLISALDVASRLYLRGYRMDVEDNLLARKHATQVRLLRRALAVAVVVVTVSSALMTFDDVRQYGVSLLASAGAAALILGLAMQPVLGNLVAGIQLAITQPIRLEDAVVVENEWGWVEEITATYVVIRLWDWRRLVLPLSYFIERPFQNWTREQASIIGSVFLYLDHRTPVPRLREKLQELVRESPLWDGQVVNLQVTDATERSVEVRILVSARNSPTAWDLRCHVREEMIFFLQTEHPESLPRHRAELGSLREAPTGEGTDT